MTSDGGAQAAVDPTATARNALLQAERTSIALRYRRDWCRIGLELPPMFNGDINAVWGRHWQWCLLWTWLGVQQVYDQAWADVAELRVAYNLAIRAVQKANEKGRVE